MTTIAVNGLVMACDSMEVIEIEEKYDRAYYHEKKIFRVEFNDGGEELIGGAGSSDGVLLWLEWYEGGCNDDDLLKRMAEFDFDIIILSPDGTLIFSNGNGIFQDICEPFFAIGSGTKAALAAMHCGKSAAEAVEIAKRIDPHTGGDVQEFTFE